MNDQVKEKAKEIIEAWEQDNMVMYTELRRLPGENYYTVNGEKIQGGKIIIDGDATVIKHSTSIVLIGAKDKTGCTISQEEYDAVRASLLAEQDEDGYWNSLDAEFAYKKFAEMWVQLSEKQSKEEVVEFNTHPNVRPVNDHVIPMRKVGGDLTDTVYTYHKGAFIASLVKEFFASEGYEVVSRERFGYPKPKQLAIDDVDGAKFHDGVNGSQYLTIAIRGLNKYKDSRNLRGTVEECVSHQEADREDVHEILMAYKQKDRVIDAMTLGEIRRSLEAIHRQVSKIESKVKTDSEFRTSLRMIRKLDKKLTEFCNVKG